MFSCRFNQCPTVLILSSAVIILALFIPSSQSTLQTKLSIVIPQGKRGDLSKVTEQLSGRGAELNLGLLTPPLGPRSYYEWRSTLLYSCGSSHVRSWVCFSQPCGKISSGLSYHMEDGSMIQCDHPDTDPWVDLYRSQEWCRPSDNFQSFPPQSDSFMPVTERWRGL